MYKNFKITLCMPARNESSHLAEVISKVPEVVDEIIVVSNQSTDNTVDVARLLGGRVRLLQDDRVIDGIGYGYAYMTAFQHATGDLVLTADADGTYPIEKVTEFIEYLFANNIDFLSCARDFHTSEKVATKILIGNKLLTVETRLLYGRSITDVLSGMWLFKKSILPDLKLSEGGWNLSPQIKVNAVSADNIVFGELAIEQAARFGQSHQRYFKTGTQHAYWLLKNKIGYLPKTSDLKGQVDAACGISAEEL